MLRIANRVATPEDVKAAGDYAIFDLTSYGKDGIKFCCPHEGCGDICHLPIGPRHSNGWMWLEAAETLSPSIQRLDKERCAHHFSLTKGTWVP